MVDGHPVAEWGFRAVLVVMAGLLLCAVMLDASSFAGVAWFAVLAGTYGALRPGGESWSASLRIASAAVAAAFVVAPLVWWGVSPVAAFVAAVVAALVAWRTAVWGFVCNVWEWCEYTRVYRLLPPILLIIAVNLYLALMFGGGVESFFNDVTEVLVDLFGGPADRAPSSLVP